MNKWLKCGLIGLGAAGSAALLIGVGGAFATGWAAQVSTRSWRPAFNF